MRALAKITALGLICAAGLVHAKEGVQNPAVKARMDAMATIAANTKALGQMAGGAAPFDAAKAAEYAAALSATAATAADLFVAPETDPVSDARPEIWTNWADFSAKADALAAAAQALDTASVETLAAGMPAVAGSCKSCHSQYRN